jgi:DNA repair exonuclease SbcCD ATPase subunit
LPSTRNDAASRKESLEHAFHAAEVRLAELKAEVAQSQSAGHVALTSADFDAAQGHHAAVDAAQAAIPAAEAAVEALRAALLEVAAEVQQAEHRSQRDALDEAIAATKDQLRDKLAQAAQTILDVHRELAEARFIDDDFAQMQLRRSALDVALGEASAAARHAKFRPVADALATPTSALAKVAALTAEELRPLTILVAGAPS